MHNIYCTTPKVQKYSSGKNSTVYLHCMLDWLCACSDSAAQLTGTNRSSFSTYIAQNRSHIFQSEHPALYWPITISDTIFIQFSHTFLVTDINVLHNLRHNGENNWNFPKWNDQSRSTPHFGSTFCELYIPSTASKYFIKTFFSNVPIAQLHILQPTECLHPCSKVAHLPSG